MSQLAKIIEAATDGADLGLVLRKCKVLAARLGSDPLEDWLKWESNGYPDEVDVPDYRKWGVVWFGNFVGEFGTMDKAPIPSACFPVEIRDKFNNYQCRQSVTAIEQVIRQEDSSYRITNSNIAPVLGQKVYQGYSCLQAIGVFDTGEFVEVLNTVRNRVLDFLLALDKVQPKGVEGAREAQKIDPSEVSQIFNSEVMHVTVALRDNYESSGQVGAMGASAHARDFSFEQVWNQVKRDVDLGQLRRELAKLREAMQSEATEPAHQLAIGAVMAAEKEAETGNGAKVMEYLKAAGKWTADVATQLGVGTVLLLIDKVVKEEFP